MQYQMQPSIRMGSSGFPLFAFAISSTVRKPKPLILHRDILEDIRTFYETALHVPMPENNTQQAELPEGCTVFDNPLGTAPGCDFESGGVHVLMLPGPPHEM